MSIDFQQLRQRLQTSLDRLKAGSKSADADQVLRQRARHFAALRLESDVRDVLLEAIVVRRSESLLAFPIETAIEVREVVSTRLPHRTRHVCGLFQLRGKVHCLVDLQPFIGPATELAHRDHTLALLIQGQPGLLGLRIDEVLGPRTFYVDELDTGSRDKRLEFVTDVTRDCIEIIDVYTLFASPALRMAAER